MLLMPLLMFFLFFSVMCVWLHNVDSLMNCDFEIQHFEKVVFGGVNKTIMEHLMKLYREIVLGYILHVYDGRKNLYTVGPLTIPIQGVPNKPSWGI